MGRIIAGILVVIFLWWAYPHFVRGEWLVPTALPPGWWGLDYDETGSSRALAMPPEGYGWFRFDFWNNPPTDGRSVDRDDFRAPWKR